MFLLKPVISAALSFSNPIRVSFIVLVILVAVIAGPFATITQLGLLERVLYWSVTVVVSVFVAQFVTAVVARAAPTASAWQAVAIKTLGMGILLTPFLYGWTVLVVLSLQVDVLPFHLFLGDVLLISLAIFTVREILTGRIPVEEFEHSEAGTLAVTPNTEATPALPEIPEPRLQRRIDQDDPGPILRLEALDHFVTAVTPKSHYHLRMRFADAVDEMDAVEGVVTHRSHWVAVKAVTGAEREKGRLFLTVACGTRVPVSRKHMPAVDAYILSVTGLPRHRNADGAGAGQHGNGTGRHQAG